MHAHQGTFPLNAEGPDGEASQLQVRCFTAAPPLAFSGPGRPCHVPSFSTPVLPTSWRSLVIFWHPAGGRFSVSRTEPRSTSQGRSGPSRVAVTPVSKLLGQDARRLRAFPLRSPGALAVLPLPLERGFASCLWASADTLPVFPGARRRRP